jgi:tRNA threonylcarbamoyl adenosine modification protein YeaZ
VGAKINGCHHGRGLGIQEWHQGIAVTALYTQPNTLAIDVSSTQASIAISSRGKCLAKKNWSSAKANAGILIQNLEQLRETAGISWDQLHSILVGCGPGQYAGLRVSIVAAQTLQLPGKGSTYGIPSAYSMLSSMHAFVPQYTAYIACGDARRNHIWTYVWIPGDTRRFPEMQCLSTQAFSQLIVPDKTCVVSPDYERLQDKIDLPLGAHWKSENTFPHAEQLLQIATAHPEVCTAPEIIYVHPPVFTAPKQNRKP